MKRQRILILMSNTGGGHRASALALQSGFHRLYPDRFDIDIIDLLAEHTFWPLSRSPEIYSAIATRAPWLWGGVYSTERSPDLIRAVMQAPAQLAKGKVNALIDQQKPDLILSVHPLAQDIVLPVTSDRRPHLPFVTVVTDLASIHPLWLHGGVDACYVATDEAVTAAQSSGVTAEKVFEYGLPVRLAFADPRPTRPQLKQVLGLDEQLPAALLMGGGDGVGPVEEIAVAVDFALATGGSASGQIVVICGRNRSLLSRLEARTWKTPTRLLGFVENVPEWMNASDCIVTKAGPGAIAESCICALPMILSGFIPGQEEANIGWVVGHQAGVAITEPSRIGSQVADWFGAQFSERRKLAENARRLGRPRATFDIVDSIVTILDES